MRALRLCALFESASRTTVEEAAGVAGLELIRAGLPVVTQGEPATLISLLGEGRVRLERNVDGGHLVPLGYRGSGELVGEFALAGSSLFSESAITMEESEVVRFPIAAMRGFLHADPALATAFLRLLVSRQREVEDRVESLLFRTVEGRLAEFLLRAAERWGMPDPKGTLIAAPITHHEIAQAIGSTRETVTITLGSLRRERVLDVAGRRLIVVDRDALTRRR